MRHALACAVLSALLTLPAPSLAQWDTRFGGSSVGEPGFSTSIYTVARDGSTPYVAGQGWGVWYWNGTDWQRLGDTLASTLRALAVLPNHEIYVGGSFSAINVGSASITCQNIAHWNGATWEILDIGGSLLTRGVNSGVEDIAVAANGTDIYVGGHFSQAGNIATAYLTRWDGAAWHTVASDNLNGTVYDILVSGNDLYVGGDFTVPFTRVMHHDGSLYEFINGGPDGRVYALALYNGDLIAAGDFSAAGGAQADGVARWNGSNWTAVVTSLTSNYVPSLTSLSVIGTDMYITGGFTAINGVSANNVARWNGSSWSAMSTGVSGHAFASLGIDGELWVGGGFSSVGVQPANGIARWTGSGWGFGGASDVVRDIDAAGSTAYVVGDFLQAGSTSANRVAYWNGSAWSKLGSGVDGSARCVARMGSDVFVGGNFESAGGVPAARIARWNGSAWSPLGNGLIGIPYDLAVDGTDLYVGGTIKPVLTPYDNIVRWDGSAWHPLGTEYPDAPVRSVVVDNGRVFIGGDFANIGPVQANRVAMWNGSAWTAFGSGVNASVYSLAVDGDEVYAVGDFTTAGGNTANRIARWTGTQWVQVGTGLNGSGRRVAKWGSQIFVAGDFGTMNGVSAPNVARFVSPSWTSLGGGTDDRVLAMALTPDGVFLGGDFRNAGSVSSDRVAFWDEALPTPAAGAPVPLRLEQNIPNPFNPSTTIRYTLASAGTATLRIYDVRGALVRTLVNETQTAGAHAVDWDGRNHRGVQMASGTYFCRLEANGATRSRKLTLLK